MSNYKGKSTNKRGSRSTNHSKREESSKAVRGDRFDSKSATNNPEWYGNDPALLRDSASLPFSYAVGTPLDLHNPALDVLPSGQAFTVPGICMLVTSPAIGRADVASDPINTAAFSVYSYVRHLNSGHANYDAPDLMIYLLAMSQVYSYINFLQRAYGIANTYAQKNRYMPDRILDSMAIDASDVRSHLADFRYGINMLINKAASLCVPATMSIFAKHASLYQNLYIEGESIKDQIYFYTPMGFWKFTLASDGSGKLEHHGIRKKVNNVQDLLDYGNDMLARLIQSEDMNIMSGDIRKAYGDDRLIKLVALPSEYACIPLNDLAVLQQIKNTTVVQNVTNLNVEQDSTHGWLLFQPKMEVSFAEDSYSSRAQTYIPQTYMEDKVLTVQTVEPTPAEVMESTRGMVVMENYSRHEDGLSASADLFPCSEIVREIQYIRVDGNNPSATEKYMTYYSGALDASDVDAVAKYMLGTSMMNNFKFHPATHTVVFKDSGDGKAFNIANANLIFDVDNYTVINGSVLKRMHEAALLSMLNVPSIIKV